MAEANLWPGCPASADAEAGASVVMSAPFRAFRDRLCILRSLDMHDLVDAGVIDGREGWDVFQEDETLFFLSLGDDQAARLWGLVQARMPAELRA